MPAPSAVALGGRDPMDDILKELTDEVNYKRSLKFFVSPFFGRPVARVRPPAAGAT
jgi:hypothetical protein